MAQWEYETVEVAVTEKNQEQAFASRRSAWLAILNEKGREGWELVQYEASTDSDFGRCDASFVGLVKRQIGTK